MTEREKAIKRRSNREKWSLRAMIALFSIISFYTSYTGILKLAGVSEYNYILKIFMAILIFGLQFALVFSVNAFYIKDIFKKHWLKAISVLLIYLITMTMSVTFSFSYWYEEFSAENYAKRSSEMQLNSVKESLLKTKNSFSFMKESLNDLSKYSASKSNREKSMGGTCGGVPKIGVGPFTWLRADDAKYTKSYSEEIQKLQTSLDKEIDQVSNYLATFDPKGDVVQFNNKVNSRIKTINVKFFNNQTLSELKAMLLKRSGTNRRHIRVVSKKTNNISNESCPDFKFTLKARQVISRINALKPIETLDFFDMSDTQKLFGRTTGVLLALVNPAYDIKDSDEIDDPSDITYDDIYAVSAGFVIDFLILLMALYAKEPKEDLVPIDTVKKILNGDYPNEVLNKLRLFLAEMSAFYLIAIPNDADDEEIENQKQFMLYMQQNKLATLYINELKANRLNEYFSPRLEATYPDSTFRVYKIDKSKFNKFILQNIEEGVRYAK